MIKRIRILTCLLAGFLLAIATVRAQEIDVLIRDAEQMEATLKEKEAFRLFKEVLKKQPVHAYALTKCSELSSRIGHREKDNRVRDEYYQAAAIYARTALKYFPQDDEAHVAMAIALGRTALTKSGKEKIAQVKEIRQHAETALRLNPRNFKAWHIIGKWHFEVSSLNMMEKAAIKVFYGGLPQSSVKSSIEAYEKARAINPNFMLNYLELAKALKKDGEKQKAISMLQTIQGMPIHTEDDPRIRQEAADLLNRWD
ncbi:MAG TPA: hypothetical protein DCQ34_04585 [Chitinophagaceae bacterium]|nr:hypothetical protein [Chitinophagaceae bacterium]